MGQRPGGGYGLFYMPVHVFYPAYQELIQVALQEVFQFPGGHKPGGECAGIVYLDLVHMREDE